MRAEGAIIRVVVVTLDNHLAGAAARAEATLRRTHPGLRLAFHAAADWEANPASLDACRADIAAGDVVIATMLFLDDHIKAVLPALTARREHCDAMVGALSDAAIVRLTRLGDYRMDRPAKGPLALLKRLRGSSKPGTASSGSGQMAMLKRLPKILRFIPGTAQDVRAYFLTLQYWLAGSDDNFANLIRTLVDRYADGERRGLRGTMTPAAPAEYPDLGVYHPRLPGRIATRAADLPIPSAPATGTVGMLILRSYVLGSDTGHYDGVIAAFEARGLRVIPAFASGLDSRPAVDAFFTAGGKPTIDALVSLTGFSLVGGPAYNDAAAAADTLAGLDVPYLAAHPLEFQTLQAWGRGTQGLLPLEATMMVAIPELDGATVPTVFGGRSDGTACAGCGHGCTFPTDGGSRVMQPCPERAAALADRTIKLIDLRRADRAARKVAIVVFNFPPNAGAVGTAAYLSVFASVFNTLARLKAEGYAVDLPADVDALRDALLVGNAARFGADGNVAARIATDDHVRREAFLAEIEAQWGPAPGRSFADAHGIHVLGAHFGNVFVGVQPPFGYEGDPMRLLFDGTFSPTHAFSAFYRWLREDFAAHAVLHFGTHGALEFMPGKQAGLSATSWPDRLIGALPNFYLYAANNPSEGTIAKRRSNATLISYLTPPIAQAGLYKGLLELRATLDRYRATLPDAAAERAMLALLIQTQAAAVDLCPVEPVWTGEAAAEVLDLTAKVYELEATLIPHGLHVVGRGCTVPERVDLLAAIADAQGRVVGRDAIAALVAGDVPADAGGDTFFADLAATDALLAVDTELDAIVHALDGGYIRPAPGGDVLRTPAVLPTGRNSHGFDPFRIPSAFACRDGDDMAAKLIARRTADGGAAPESIAMVLWGTDNLKTEGAQIAQVLALMGARPRRDGYGRLCGAELIPLAELGRARIDVVVTLSGIFRDLLPMQTRMIAEAAYLASVADEPDDLNFIRKHSLAHAARLGCDLDTAALRVFSNAEGAYGANVNLMIDAGVWADGDELADAFEARKGFAYGRAGAPTRQATMFKSALAGVELTYQNLDSVELGVTSVDQYVDSLGGISRSIARAKGSAAPVYIGDATQGAGKVRTLGEQVALETRTRMLNPLWTEGMLASGFEGVRQIEVHMTNTMGWSATTGDVAPWVYQRTAETYILDGSMRARLADLNPKAAMRVASRLLEAHARDFWQPDAATLAALRDASDDLEDRLEGITPAMAA